MTYITPENMTGLSGMMTYANTVSGGIFGNGLLISLYVIILVFLHNKGFDFTACMSAAGFITMIAGVLMFVLGLIGNWAFFVLVVLTFLPVVWTFFNRGNI